MNEGFIVIGFFSLLIGSWVRHFAFNDYPVSEIIYDMPINTGVNAILKPFRLHNKGFLKIELDGEFGLGLRITDYFPGGNAETSGVHYFKSDSIKPVKRGKTKMLQAGDYVLRLGPSWSIHLKLEKIEYVKKHQSWMLLGNLIAEIGVAILAAGLTLN